MHNKFYQCSNPINSDSDPILIVFIPNTNPILDHFEAGLHLSLIHKINKPTHDQERFIPYKIKVLDYEK